MKKKKLLYVVHRYPPYPGGSENYVRDLAEESVMQGHDVTVFTGMHKGDRNGVKVTNDVNILNELFDLIIVHCCNTNIQRHVLINAKKIRSPILYLLIEPYETSDCLDIIKNVKFLGCSTIEDWEYVKKYNVTEKSAQISHCIDPKVCLGVNGFRQKYGINTKKMFLCSGGFWKHKGMEELIDIFNRLPMKDTTLVLTGYQHEHLMPEGSERIKVLLLEERQEMLNAMKEADLYIMNSYQEGFGLVLLEAMLNKTPWISRNIAGAKLMNKYGNVFNNAQELMKLMFNSKKEQNKIEEAYNYMLENHITSNTVKQIINLCGE